MNLNILNTLIILFIDYNRVNAALTLQHSRDYN